MQTEVDMGDLPAATPREVGTTLLGYDGAWSFATPRVPALRPDTQAIEGWLGQRSIVRGVVYTALAAVRFLAGLNCRPLFLGEAASPDRVTAGGPEL
jgi:hypothetical protein